MGYYLADGIYPSRGTFVKTIPRPKTKKELSLQRHKKLAERILREILVICKLGLLLFMAQLVWDKKSLIDIMKACVILHNMIMEDERDLNLEFFFDNVGRRAMAERNPDHIQAFFGTYQQTEDSATHAQLN
jgi:hypothetical protein